MEEIGTVAGWLYFVWAFFLMIACVGVHHAYAVAYVWASRFPQPPRGLLVFEVFYGLLNPVVYLLVLQPVLFRSWTPSWLPTLCWFTWAGFWITRFAGDRVPRRWFRAMMFLTLGLVVCVALRDAAVLFTDSTTTPEKASHGFSNLVVGAACLPLYVLPLATAWRGLRATTSEATWASSDFALKLPPRIQRALLGGCAVVILAALPHRSRAGIEAELLRNREVIVALSRERRLDPRLLPAIVLVTQRELQTPFRALLEETITGAWLLDSKSGLLLAEAFDPSLGLAQVKANTVLTAYAIVFLSDPDAPRYLNKDYRSARHLSGETIDRISAPELRVVRRPTDEALPYKPTIVQALKTSEGNLAATAFLLDLLAAQWELADPTWSIRSRPDILATLFQLGFDRSVPRADPRSNDFGARVVEAMRDPWINENFGTAP